MWKYSRHIKERMDERCFSRDEIEKILNGDVPVLVIPSPKAHNGCCE